MLTPSTYTRCHEGTHGRLHVTHETNHIYRHDGMDNQHVCRMASGVCQCCDCLPQLSLTTLPDEMRALPVGTYTMRSPFLAHGKANRKRNLVACQLACAQDERCALAELPQGRRRVGRAALDANELPARDLCSPAQTTSRERHRQAGVGRGCRRERLKVDDARQPVTKECHHARALGHVL